MIIGAAIIFIDAIEAAEAAEEAADAAIQATEAAEAKAEINDAEADGDKTEAIANETNNIPRIQVSILNLLWILCHLTISLTVSGVPSL